MSPDEWASVKSALLVMLFALVVSMALVVQGLRRVFGIRRKALALSEEHERVALHAQYRLAGQRYQAMAAAAEGEERIAHLRQAIEMWRLANQNRDPGDEDTYEHIKRIIALIEEELTALGAAPEL